jgi:hypothetical protein
MYCHLFELDERVVIVIPAGRIKVNIYESWLYKIDSSSLGRYHMFVGIQSRFFKAVFGTKSQSTAVKCKLIEQCDKSRVFGLKFKVM